MPSDFGICEPEYDLTLMAAYMVAKRKMEAWELKQAQKEAKRYGAHGKTRH